eukprot:Nk52_evm26s272 gene=Nk52_evmTU26s272
MPIASATCDWSWIYDPKAKICSYRTSSYLPCDSEYRFAGRLACVKKFTEAATMCDYNLMSTDNEVKYSCDQFGNFNPTQCAYGMCFCVDQEGYLIHGTVQDSSKVNGGADLECHKPNDGPCNKALRGELTLNYKPTCTPKGDFALLQCNQNNQCFCVDPASGENLLGYKSKAGERKPDCHLDTSQSDCVSVRNKLKKKHPELEEIVAPVCEPSGAFRMAQCDESHSRCICVDPDAGDLVQEVSNPPPVGTLPDCKAIVKAAAAASDESSSVAKTSSSVCESDRDYALGEIDKGQGDIFVPLCTQDGDFNRIQCWAETNYCWCADEKTGEPIKNTLVYGGALPDCATKRPQASELAKESCENHRISPIQAADGTSIDAYRAECALDGSYKDTQCGYDRCVCVNKMTGEQIPEAGVFKSDEHVNDNYCSEKRYKKDPNTTQKPSPAQDNDDPTKNGHANTASDKSSEQTDMTPLCMQHRKYAAEHRGYFVPECDDKGNYVPLQCRTSIDLCWCVDPVNGTDLVHSHTHIADPKPKCSDLGPKTECQQQRAKDLKDRAQRGKIVEVIHHCTKDGRYTPTQCHIHNGYCWCVSQDHGKKVYGTMVKGWAHCSNEKIEDEGKWWKGGQYTDVSKDVIDKVVKPDLKENENESIDVQVFNKPAANDQTSFAKKVWTGILIIIGIVILIVVAMLIRRLWRQSRRYSTNNVVYQQLMRDMQAEMDGDDSDIP